MKKRGSARKTRAAARTAPRVAVIGLGHWGRNLVRNVAGLDALGAMCDSAAEARRAHAALHPGVLVTGDAASVLDDPAIEAVMIATPAATHGAYVAAALDAGKHVFVEKPLCLDVAEAEALVQRAKRAGRVLMVGHLLHYHPAFIALKATVAAGRLGRLRYIYSTRLSLGRIRREENALWSFAPHDVSMILALTGALPERVIATGGHYLTSNVADTTLSHLAFAGGVQAHIFVSWLHPYKDQRLVVVGEDAMAVFNDVAPEPDKLVLYRHKAQWSGDLPVIDRAEGERIPFESAEPLRRECEAFLAALAGGPAPPSSGPEGVRVLRVLSACQRALESGSPIALDAETGA
ncbi:MAG TPA: Gfo/Idh/MocA family oxidoreductase [Alphaproteobacteria bacterium]|jgi:UDP-2-acetamido-3-amino-2,3-dideoxy-glucuronate N-acetyltransferase